MAMTRTNKNENEIVAINNVSIFENGALKTRLFSNKGITNTPQHTDSQMYYRNTSRKIRNLWKQFTEYYACVNLGI